VRKFRALRNEKFLRMISEEKRGNLKNTSRMTRNYSLPRDGIYHDYLLNAKSLSVLQIRLYLEPFLLRALLIVTGVLHGLIRPPQVFTYDLWQAGIFYEPNTEYYRDYWCLHDRLSQFLVRNIDVCYVQVGMIYDCRSLLGTASQRSPVR